MHFHKYPYTANFEFATSPANGKLKTTKGSLNYSIRASRDGIFHLQIKGKGWQKNESTSELEFHPEKNANSAKLTFQNADLRLEDAEGNVLLKSAEGRAFGQCGEASIFEFIKEKDDQFYGMGEKWSGFEHSGKTTKFWNTDVWADFHHESYANGKPAPDPVYLSVPYLIIKRGNRFIGLLLDNPYASFMSTGFKISIAEQMTVKEPEGVGHIHIGAERGQPNLYVIIGPSLAELTQKLQKLVGPTPRPPGWALGYHQCRWGYQSEKDLVGLDQRFRKEGIPVDGLWLDIDYMRGFRVFTFDPIHFPDPAKAMKKLAKSNRKVIPILDPGVKWESGYDVYERGKKAKAYCLNSQGGEYVGLVWPGQTVFPDYSLPTARKWWADEVSDFAKLGIYGAWLDMNDPATGPADTDQMRFDYGKKNHDTYHNQYALGMAKATREGFLQARPDQRPFLLCRSGFTGSGRHTAIWTGDNFSNYHHLKNSIATTLNLALSGIPFNGPDAGGFGDNTTPQLIQDWFKAGFLFPVLRNHTLKNTRQQEPWAFGPAVTKVLKKYIQLRYRLRPYLYQLFIANEHSGDAILRPLFYDFNDTAKLPLGKIDDQFLVGSSILQAPFVEEGQKTRKVVLPSGTRWMEVSTGQWQNGGRKVTVKATRETTPWYVRDFSILPLARLSPEDHLFKPNAVDFHLFISKNGTAETTYEFDDGTSFAYRDGAASCLQVSARRKGDEVDFSFETLVDGAGQAEVTFTVRSEIKKVSINGRPAKKIAAQGVPLGAYRTQTWGV